MKLGNSRGIKTGQWLNNEILRYEDINFLSQAQYQIAIDLLALIADQETVAGTTKDLVMGGLQLVHSSGLICTLKPGAALSYSGSYWNNDSWAFQQSAGDMFAVIVPVDTSVTFAVGGGSHRIDTLEVRPVRNSYNLKSRQFKCPITGEITSAYVNTRLEFDFEYQILKGVGGAGVAPTKTLGWIKLAEVFVEAGTSKISQKDIRDIRDSALWTTEASNTVNGSPISRQEIIHSSANPSGGQEGNMWVKFRA